MNTAQNLLLVLITGDRMFNGRYFLPSHPPTGLFFNRTWLN